MHEAKLYDRLPGLQAGCNICRWHCKINPGKTGVCRMYENRGGTLYSLNYGLPSSIAADPVEKKPLYHFYPGTKVFSMGAWGCNFKCQDCQNWQISSAGKPGGSRPEMDEILPHEAINMAKQHGCRGIAWTYNEPTVWFEYTLDSARLAKEQGLYTVYVTNGYMTRQALDGIGPYLDVWRVDIKAFSADTYRKWCGIYNWQGILETAEHARHHWGMHVEVVTNIVPGVNDDDGQLKGIAGWISGKLGVLTPWHVTRFHPVEKMAAAGITPLETLEKAVKIGYEAGLKFIYIGNVPGNNNENTVCPECLSLVVERRGYRVDAVGLNGSKCKYCGLELNFRTDQGGV